MTPARLWSRPLVPLMAALAGGIAAPSLGLSCPPAWTALAVMALLLLSAVLFWRGLPLAWMGCLLFFCLGQGLYYTALHPDLPAHHVSRLPRNTPLSLVGVVQNRPLPSGRGDSRLELAASAWSGGDAWQPAAGMVRVSGLHPHSGLEPGDLVALRLSLWPVEDLKNPGSAGRALALARRHIFVTGRLWQHLPPLKLNSDSSLSWWAAWREQARQYCRTLLADQPQPARSIFLALLLGDQSEISQPLRQALNRTGTSHLVAVSGLHLALIAAWAYVLIFWLGRTSVRLLLRFQVPKGAALLAAGPVIAYAWVAGGSPSTQRAALMILAGLMLLLLDRRRDIYSALALAAFLILVASPLQLYSLSFQLSFLSVWGLACLAPALQRPWQHWLQDRQDWPAWLPNSLSWLGKGLTVSLAATLATLPVIVGSFHQAPTYGIVVNVLAVPLMGGLVLPLSFLAVLLSWLPPAVPAGILYLSRLILDFSLSLIQQAAALPGVVVRLPGPTPWQTAAYFLIVLSLFGASQRLWRRTGASLGALMLAGSLAWSGLNLLAGSQLVLTALDSPREMALAATFPTGAAMVINAGASRYFTGPSQPNFALLAHLHGQRRQRLDFLAALSVTPENAATLLALAQEFHVGQFWYNGDRPYIQSFWELRNLLGDSRQEVKNLAIAPQAIEIGGVRVQTRQLPGTVGGRPSGPVLLQLACQGRRLLIVPPATAAWRRQCLAAGLDPSEVLILPASNLRGDFLESCLGQVKPKWVIVAGTMPADAMVGKEQDISWHCTRQGAVTVAISPDKVQVSQWRP